MGPSAPTNLGPSAPNYAALNLFLPQQTMVWLRRVITHTHTQTYTHTVTYTHTCYCEIVWLRRDVTCYTLVIRSSTLTINVEASMLKDLTESKLMEVSI